MAKAEFEVGRYNGQRVVAEFFDASGKSVDPGVSKISDLAKHLFDLSNFSTRYPELKTKGFYRSAAANLDDQKTIRQFHTYNPAKDTPSKTSDGEKPESKSTDEGKAKDGTSPAAKTKVEREKIPGFPKLRGCERVEDRIVIPSLNIPFLSSEENPDFSVDVFPDLAMPGLTWAPVKSKNTEQSKAPKHQVPDDYRGAFKFVEKKLREFTEKGIREKQLREIASFSGVPIKELNPATLDLLEWISPKRIVNESALLVETIKSMKHLLKHLPPTLDPKPPKPEEFAPGRDPMLPPDYTLTFADFNERISPSFEETVEAVKEMIRKTENQEEVAFGRFESSTPMQDFDALANDLFADMSADLVEVVPPYYEVIESEASENLFRIVEETVINDQTEEVDETSVEERVEQVPQKTPQETFDSNTPLNLSIYNLMAEIKKDLIPGINCYPEGELSLTEMLDQA